MILEIIYLFNYPRLYVIVRQSGAGSVSLRGFRIHLQRFVNGWWRAGAVVWMTRFVIACKYGHVYTCSLNLHVWRSLVCKHPHTFQAKWCVCAVCGAHAPRIHACLHCIHFACYQGHIQDHASSMQHNLGGCSAGSYFTLHCVIPGLVGLEFSWSTMMDFYSLCQSNLHEDMTSSLRNKY